MRWGGARIWRANHVFYFYFYQSWCTWVTVPGLLYEYGVLNGSLDEF